MPVIEVSPPNATADIWGGAKKCLEWADCWLNRIILTFTVNFPLCWLAGRMAVLDVCTVRPQPCRCPLPF